MPRTPLLHPTTMLRLCQNTSQVVQLTTSGGATTAVGTLRHSDITPAEKYRELVPESDQIADMHECYAIPDGDEPSTHLRLLTENGDYFRIRYIQRWPAQATRSGVYFWRMFLEPTERLM